nr:FliM/FliN family flagellar motor switch protein [Gammaproteobacteria bacterium]
ESTEISRISLEKINHSVDDQVVVACKYALKIDDSEFNLEMIFSHSMLEPHQKVLQRIKQKGIAESSEFSSALKNELMNCEIDMHAVLAETKITLAELIELKAGDFIPLREIENVSFKSNSAPLFDARVGKFNGQVSASFSRWTLQGVS